jgi:hypothetical protein
MPEIKNSILCPWCSTYYDVRTSTNCANCGGTLPPPAGPHRGEHPPSTPRFIPKQFRNKVLFSKNYMLLGGSLFAIANIPFTLRINGLEIIMIGLGGYFAWRGYNTAMKKVKVLQHGKITEGLITSVRENENTEVNGKHPFLIEYNYEVNGSKHKGGMNCWDETSLSHYEGEPVWIVYLDENMESNSSIWPPLA